MAQSKQTIAVVGSINVDVLVTVDRHPSPGETVVGSSQQVLPGGKGANQAVAAGLLGADVQFFGAVGTDDYAHRALGVLRQSGVNLDHVRHVPGSTGLAMITVAASGENTIVVLPAANSAVDRDYVRQMGDPLALADIVLLQGEIPRKGNEAAVEAARGRVVINLAPVVPMDTAALLRADPLIVNEHEGSLVLAQFGVTLETGRSDVAQDRAAEDCTARDPLRMVRALRECGFASVVMTLGAQGSVCADASGMYRIPAAQVPVVDTTGAGDAFTGACVAKLAEGFSLRDACVFASRVGSYATMRHGAQTSYPTADTVLPDVDGQVEEI
ncbi:MAG: ribokinase [Actinomycetaceae bacterium]|nr:ribokinase [Actinomycetaceae bacterium]MDY6083413.1 ribokinase [Actinomycetaceae bacterium]